MQRVVPVCGFTLQGRDRGHGSTALCVYMTGLKPSGGASPRTAQLSQPSW